MADQRENVTITGKDELSPVFDGMVASARELERAADRMGAAWDHEAGRFRSNTSGQFVKGIDVAKEAVGDLTDKVRGTGAVFDETTGRWRDASGKFINATERAEQGLKNFSAQGGRTASAAKGWMGEIATGAARFIGESIVNAVGRAFDALGDLGKKGLTLAADFEKGSLKLKTLGVTGETLVVLNDQAKDLGLNTIYSSGQVQTAMTDLIKTGIDPAETRFNKLNDVVKDTLNLAAADNVEVPVATELMGNMLQVWAGEVDKANGLAMTSQEIADSIIAAADASALGVADMGVGLGQAMAPGKALGLTLKDVALALALVRPQAGSTSDAGTTLKNMFINVAPRTSKARELMAAYGISALDTDKSLRFLAAHGMKTVPKNLDEMYAALFKVGKQQKMFTGEGDKGIANFEKWILKTGLFSSKLFDIEGNFKGIANFGDVMKEQLGGLSSEELTPVLTEMFGDGQKAVMAFIQAGGDGFRDLEAKSKSALTAAQKADMMSQGLGFNYELFKKRVDAAAQSMVEAFLPGLTETLKGMGDGALGVARFAESFKEAPDKMMFLKDSFPEIFGFLADAGELFSPLGEALGRLGSTIATEIGDRWPAMALVLQEIWVKLGPVASDLIVVLAGFVDWVTANIPVAIGMISDELLKMGESISRGLDEWEEFKVWLTNVWKDLEDGIILWGAAFSGNWLAVWDRFDEIISNWWTELNTKMGGWPNTLKDIGVSVIKGLINGMLSQADAVFKALRVDIFGGAIKGIKDFLGIKSPSRLFSGIGKDTVDGYVMGIKKESSKVVDAVTEFVFDATTQSYKIANKRDSRAVLSDVFGIDVPQYMATLERTIPKVVAARNQVWSKMLGAPTVQQLPEKLDRWWEDGIVKTIEESAGAQKALDTMKDFGSELLRGMASGILDSVEEVAGAAAAGAAAIAGSVVAATTSALDTFKQGGDDWALDRTPAPQGYVSLPDVTNPDSVDREDNRANRTTVVQVDGAVIAAVSMAGKGTGKVAKYSALRLGL